MNNHPNHHTTNLAERVLERIEEEHLAPRPRWEFLFKNYVFWTLGALAVLFGALAFAAALFEVQNAGWRFALTTHSDLMSFLLEIAPYLWVVALTLFILLGYLNIRRTNHGYRYPLALIALGAVLSSAAFGGFINAAGLGQVIEESVGNHLPFYRPILAQQHSWWVAPEKGLLGGKVIFVQPDASFTLRDFSGQTWTVASADVASTDIKAIMRGGDVRVVGLPTTATSSAFHACFVFPWESHQISVPHEQESLGVTQVSSTEISRNGERSDECKGIRPYQQLRKLEELGE